jgi:hypothetical protein
LEELEEEDVALDEPEEDLVDWFPELVVVRYFSSSLRSQ